MSDSPLRKRRIGVNEAGYECPRFNLESRQFAWLKHMRSAGSRATAKALMNMKRGRTALETLHGPERVIINTYRVEIADLPEQLQPFRIVQVSDVHHGPWMPIETVVALVERVNELEADVVALTGDYVINSPDYIEPVAEALSLLSARTGVLAILGNHDWWEGVDRVRAAFRSNKIPLIDNSRRFVNLHRKLVRSPTNGLCIAGVGDPWADTVNFRRALAHVPSHVPRIVLCHNPDCAEDADLLAFSPRIDFMMAGHTHGGQVCFPKKKVPVLPKLRKSRYNRGMVNSPLSPIYISSGIGTAGLPLRVGADPEIAVFDLVPAT